jgi:hydroxypyruvate reductase
VRARLEAAPDEPQNPGDPPLARSRMTVFALPAAALAAAARIAEKAGFRPVLLGDALEGRAATIAQDHARLALGHAGRGDKVAILSGGELTVEIRGQGIGGPNHEYALALALALDGASCIWALACDTDGIDGATDAAGALIGPDTGARAAAAGLDAAHCLADNNSGNVFAALGDAVLTGPTRTNVNDFRAILVNPRMR